MSALFEGCDSPAHDNCFDDNCVEFGYHAAHHGECLGELFTAFDAPSSLSSSIPSLSSSIPSLSSSIPSLETDIDTTGDSFYTMDAMSRTDSIDTLDITNTEVGGGGGGLCGRFGYSCADLHGLSSDTDSFDGSVQENRATCVDTFGV